MRIMINEMLLPLGLGAGGPSVPTSSREHGAKSRVGSARTSPSARGATCRSGALDRRRRSSGSSSSSSSRRRRRRRWWMRGNTRLIPLQMMWWRAFSTPVNENSCRSESQSGLQSLDFCDSCWHKFSRMSRFTCSLIPMFSLLTECAVESIVYLFIYF